MKKSEALSILGLQDGASEEAIKKAHRKLIIENHPDKFGQDATARAKAEEKTKLINEARDVLLSGKWDPEYRTAGTPYGAPYSYSPYQTRPSNQDGDPFASWPFAGTTFIWTTWDADGNKTTYTGNPFDTNSPFTTHANKQAGSSQSGKQNPFGADIPQNPFAGPGGRNPFMGGFPFGMGINVEPPSTEEQFESLKKATFNELKFIGIKLVVLLICVLLNFPALGLYLYTIASIGRGVWKRFGILSSLLVIPLLMLAFIFLPTAVGPVGIIGAVFFASAAYFDISNIVKAVQKLRTLNAKKNS